MRRSSCGRNRLRPYIRLNDIDLLTFMKFRIMINRLRPYIRLNDFIFDIYEIWSEMLILDTLIL